MLLGRPLSNHRNGNFCVKRFITNEKEKLINHHLCHYRLIDLFQNIDRFTVETEFTFFSVQVES